METGKQFLEKMYLPGFMTVVNDDYEGNEAWFDFHPVEPRVTVLSDIYLTPRGTHICLSQSSYLFAEQLLENKEFFNPEELQKLGFEGRLKLVRFNQRFRREVALSDVLQGKLTLTKLRPGKMPLLEMNFELGSKRDITGNLTGVIAPYSMPQTNADIMQGGKGW